MMEKEQYEIEREYLGKTTVTELVAAIIKKHNDSNRDKQVECAKTVEKLLDLL